MNNYITLFLATLVHLGQLTKDEAEKLDKELQTMNIPGEFESSFEMVKKVFEKAEIDIKTPPKK